MNSEQIQESNSSSSRNLGGVVSAFILVSITAGSEILALPRGLVATGRLELDYFVHESYSKGEYGNPFLPISFCTRIIIVGVSVIPTCCIYQIIYEYIDGYIPPGFNNQEEKQPSVFSRIIKVLDTISTFMFAFGGASCYPTIQADMKNKENFKYVSLIGIMMIFCSHPSEPIFIGDSVNSNIILSL
ncbi:unnamed protein product [Lepeophtheirus salmonis]|uniref:(salmon louse) hypothetical protein n=1 Tax=Lepeophtheirus salmonis TaxID=72036 RepID=A0A7R8D5T9_LEPSM|nr:unnamed protein product [Lepeophtheirus salmonis]CAF3038108.1 unnamed protein product [Lepeophtheirus salmonis]